jgi:hypothetical protein
MGILTALSFNSVKPNTREQIKRADLEAAITAAVKRSNPVCEPFVGVIVDRIAQNSSNDANWDVKGIKFGRSDREQCNCALSVIVPRLKTEFELVPPQRSSQINQVG